VDVEVYVDVGVYILLVFAMTVIDDKTGCKFSKIDCDDNNECTADSCDPGTGCVNSQYPPV